MDGWKEEIYDDRWTAKRAIVDRYNLMTREVIIHVVRPVQLQSIHMHIAGCKFSYT